MSLVTNTIGPLGIISDEGVRVAKQALEDAQNRLNQALTKADIEAAVLELSAAEIRLNEAIRKSKEGMKHDRQTA